MVAMRSQLMEVINELGLRGRIENDKDDKNLLHAYLGGRSRSMDEFKEFCESSICVVGVEMEVRRNPTLKDVMALPAIRSENTMIEINDRFDKAYNELVKMNLSLVKIVENTNLLPSMDKTLTRMDKTLIRVDKNVLKIEENTNLLPGMDKTLNRVDEKLTSMDKTLTGVDEKLTSMDETLTQMDSRLVKIDENTS